MEQFIHAAAATQHIPWNKGKLVGQKVPLKLKDIWAIRVRLQLANRTHELALFNLAIDSKLRSCDLVKLRVRDVCHGSVVAARDGHATKDSTASAIRNHGADTRIIADLDPSGRSSLG